MGDSEMPTAEQNSGVSHALDSDGPQPFPRDSFADVLMANEGFAETFVKTDRGGTAAKGLAIVTCMDSRIDPLQIVGMRKGDVKILRNAGARVTQDVLRTLVLATYLLGVDRVLIMPHTHCKMASASEDEIHKQIRETFGVDTRSLEIQTTPDQMAGLRLDVNRVRSYPLLPHNVVVGGALYDVETGQLTPIEI